MKYLLSFYIFCMISVTASSQIEVSKIIKPTNGDCNGTIILNFIESEIPGILTISSTDQSNPAGGQVTIESTSHTLKDLCSGDYNLSFKDNHGCVESEFVSIAECDVSDISFDIVRANCEFSNSYDIVSVTDETYFYEWNNGMTQSSLISVASGEYFVTVTDNFGCSTIKSFSIDIEPPSIIGLNQPTSNGDGCDGSVQIFADGMNAPYVVSVRVNGIIDYSSTYAEYEQGSFIIPTEFCFYNNYVITITDIEGCSYDLIPQFESISNCDDEPELTLSVYWQQSNGANGKLGFEFKKPWHVKSDFNFHLYKKDGNSEYQLYVSQDGNSLFENLPKGSYKVVAQSKIDIGCSSRLSKYLASCSSNTSEGGLPYTDKRNITNGNNGVIYIWETYPCDEPFTCTNQGVIKLISPSGIPIYDYIQSNWFLRTYENLSEEGIYKIRIDNGCGNVLIKEVELNKCPPRVAVFNNSGFIPWYEPQYRDDINDIAGYDQLEWAYDSNGILTFDESLCELAYNIDYVHSHSQHTSDQFFKYEPYDQNNPCDGGNLKSWFTQYVGGEKTIVYNDNIAISNEALYQFDWNNTDIDNSEELTNLFGMIYKVQSDHIQANPWDICESGSYCLFESLDIFPNSQLSELILLSTCQEYTDPCSLFPNSNYCENVRCSDGIKNFGEEGIDCGGVCEPCPDDTNPPIEDCYPPCMPGYECVNNDCLQECDEDNPCPIGFNCDGNGNCIESEGPCEDGVCPSGQICINGYCYPEDDDNTTEDCSDICEEIDGECIGQECYADLCGYSIYLEQDDVNNDPPIDIEFYLNHGLQAGATIEIYDVQKHAGLSLSISQGNNVLYYYGCDPENNPSTDFTIAESSTPLKVKVQPHNLGETEECWARAKHFIAFSLDCLPGKPSSTTKVIDNSLTDLKVYPNPFINRLQIESTESSIESILVYNSIGELIKEINDINQLNYTFETESLNTGMYLLNIKSNASNNIVKVLKI